MYERALLSPLIHCSSVSYHDMSTPFGSWIQYHGLVASKALEIKQHCERFCLNCPRFHLKFVKLYCM